ncbi:uncharacterized protein LOC136088451 isoform X2 [Hydra vulgaris]|uniref:Uncharacterized protein LOC136088451 isoform X2 n=1 Tax=Hydra vulgaris TaxID=6087 RepID=A0ABM4D1X9_HYDVU
MIDGKAHTALSDVTDSSQCCSLCGVSPKEMNDIDKALLKVQKKKQSWLKRHPMLIMIEMILVIVNIWKHRKLEKENILSPMKVKLMMMKLNFFRESLIKGNTNTCGITKPTPPENLRAIQSSSLMSQVKIKENASKYLNNAQSNPTDGQPGVLQPDVLSSQSKTIVETPAHVLSSFNSSVLLERLITTLEEIKENPRIHSAML